MTDEQIIKALECCINCKDCDNCPCIETKPELDAYACGLDLVSDALYLIKKQQAEIDRLKESKQEYFHNVDIYRNGIEEKYEKMFLEAEAQIRAEAIKEFEGKLYDFIISNEQVNEIMFIEKMTSLKKEMVGADNG